MAAPVHPCRGWLRRLLANPLGGFADPDPLGGSAGPSGGTADSSNRLGGSASTLEGSAGPVVGSADPLATPWAAPRTP